MVAVRLCALVCVAVLMPALARAETLHADGLDATWMQAVEHVRQALAAREDLDPTIELAVSPEASGVRIVARRSTGATAMRAIAAPEDLEPAILALVVVPRRAEPDLPVRTPLEVEPVRETQAAERRRLAPWLELGAGVTTRWHGTLAFGAAAFSDVVVGRWRIGASASWTTTEGAPVVRNAALPMTPLPPYTLRTIELGFELGRRFTVGPLEVTGLVGPRVTRSTMELGDERLDPSVRGIFIPELHDARLSGAARARWGGWYVALDATVVVAEPRDEAPLDGSITVVAPEPSRAWMLAAALGGTFEVGP